MAEGTGGRGARAFFWAALASFSFFSRRALFWATNLSCVDGEYETPATQRAPAQSPKKKKDGRRAPTFLAFLSRTSFIAGSLAVIRGTLES